MPDDKPDLSPEPKKELIPIQFLDKEPRGKTPPYMVIGDEFVAQSTQGEFRVSLRIPVRTVREMEDHSDDEQLKMLLQSRGDEDALNRLEELDDILDYREIVRKFWQAFAERQLARLGESFRSSIS